MKLESNIQRLLEKVKAVEKGEKLDLSSGEDLSVGVMNLIAIEEHLFFTYNKTGQEKYLALLNEIREMRKVLLKRLIKDSEGEAWCISKHLLSAAMRLVEVGTKSLSKGEKKDAVDLFQKAYQLYNLFWGLNLGVAKMADVKSLTEEKISFINEAPLPESRASLSPFAKLGEIIGRAVDCCRE